MCCGQVVSASPTVAPVPRGAPVAPGTPLPSDRIVLHYIGTTPFTDLASVPTGAHYRLRPDKTFVVYPADVKTLLDRRDNNGNQLFERFS